MKEIFVGIAEADAQAYLAVIQDAVRKAMWPGRLTFGICLGEKADPKPFFKTAQPAAVRILTGEGLSFHKTLEAVYGLYGGQAYALLVPADAMFLQDWDQNLTAAMALADAQRPLITGCLFPDGISRAVALGAFLPGRRLQLAPGMKVLRARRPPRTLFLSPEFIFGRGEWMRVAKEDGWNITSALDMTLRSFAAGYTAFTPHMKVLGRRLSASFPPEELPEDAMQDTLDKFGLYAGIDFEKQEAPIQAYTGIDLPGGRYPVQMTLDEGLRQLRLRRRETPISRVMLATAMGRHTPRPSLDVYTALFRNLAGFARLSLCCYCPQERVKMVQAILPNTYARQEGDGLSFADEAALAKSKPSLIAEAVMQFPAHTHYGWIDMDYVKHPVPPSAVFLWDALTDDKIHLAVVDGRVDTGLVILPRDKVDWLVETAAVLETVPEWGEGDTGVFQCLADTYPESFTLHPMEKKHMLLSLCQPMVAGGTWNDV